MTYRLLTPLLDPTDRACGASHRAQLFCVNTSGLHVHFLSNCSSKSVSVMESRTRAGSARHRAMAKGGASAYV